jgi:probable DNA metabolism protein
MEHLLLQYAQYIFSGAANAAMNFGHAAVLGVTQTARKVGREKHRMEAFVRFQQLKDGLYYAAVEPDFNVLPLILPHFRSRYADQDWLIYDLRRRYGIHYTKETGQAAEVQMDWGEHVADGRPGTSLYGEREALYQALWKDYFKHTGIPARKNPALHLRHIPKRYWRNLTEKDLF